MAMNPGMKMMMLNKAAKTDDRSRSEYGGSPDRRMIGYDRDYNTENRRRYAEGNRMAYDMEEPESRRRYAEGNRMAYDMEEPEMRRRRDSRGRYMEGDGWEDNRGYAESRYEPESRRRRDSRGRYMMDDMDYAENEMRGARSEMRSAGTWYPPQGAMPYVPHMNVAPMAAPATTMPTAMMPPTGMYGGDMAAPVDEHTARMWVGKMDGGEHFKPEQTEQYRLAICPHCEMWEFYVAMNAMYSDHCETAKKMGVDKIDYYAHMAKDFLKDSDAKPHKLRRYMEMIAK